MPFISVLFYQDKDNNLSEPVYLKTIKCTFNELVVATSAVLRSKGYGTEDLEFGHYRNGQPLVFHSKETLILETFGPKDVTTIYVKSLDYGNLDEHFSISHFFFSALWHL